MQASSSRRYRIVSVLGSGGFGTVYRAELITGAGLRREVALKVLNERAAADEQAAARLRDEARFLSSLNHVGIVRVDDLLQIEGRWILVMELVEGIDLDRLLETFGPLPTSVALELAESVARTLHAVSAATGPSGEPLGLVHRDIKPANILVTTTGSTKLLDFGVARARLSEREAATQGAVVMGSLPYLAPERFGFEDLPAGDVYALGAVLYESLFGQRLGRTRPSNTGHQEHLREALHKAWDLLAPETREPMLQLLARALAFDPSTRPPARVFASLLGELRRKVPGPSMADWAESQVQELLRQPRELEPDTLVGRVLSESNLSTTAPPPEPVLAPAPPAPEPAAPPASAATPSPTPPPPPSPHHTPVPTPPPALQVDLDDPPTADLADPAPARPEPPRPRGRWGLALVASLGLLAGVGIWLLLPGADPVQGAAPTTHPLTQGELAEDPLPELQDTGLEAAPPSPTPSPRPTPHPAPQPPPPRPERSAKATIVVKGDAEFVQLVSSEGPSRPGQVEPGTYTLFPSFPGGYRVKGPTFSLAEGERAIFRCESSTRTCTRE